MNLPVAASVSRGLPSFRLRRWSAWAPGLPSPEHWRAWMQSPDLSSLHGDGVPVLTELAPMARRRMDAMGRAALQAAFWAQGTQATGAVVFASRWGEIARSVALLRELALGHPLSPTAFSTSVHNANSAAYSIARGDTGNFTAISAGPCSAAAALCEAIGLLADGAKQVLVVSVESSLPAPYESFEDRTLPLRAWAALVEDGHELRLEASSPQLPSATGLPPDLMALQFLAGTMAELQQDGWRWTRHA